MKTATTAALLLLTLATSLPAQQKERVDGIGGFFFRAQSPKTLAQWYSDNLGVTVTPTGYGGESWKQDAGTTVFQPFPAGTKYWRADKPFMLNFRVKNLDALVAQLRKADIKVDVDPMTYPNGHFAALEDPEGNPIQLWEPKGKQ
jgi:predicted enzyme related to lactoylglutathione lyase